MKNHNRRRRVLVLAVILAAVAACGGSAATPAGGAGGASDDTIRGAFGVCADKVHVGQSQAASGVTCADVCRVLGFSGCEYRAGQAGMEACTPANPDRSGSCTDVFKEGWSSQCRCTP